MSGHRHRYAEPLADWADLHAEPVERTTGPLTEHCPTHGEHVPQSTGDCGRCLDDMDTRERARRSRRSWRTIKGAARATTPHPKAAAT